MRQLIEMDQDAIVYIDAAGRGTYEIMDIERLRDFVIIVTKHDYCDSESIHDMESSIRYFTSSRD